MLFPQVEAYRLLKKYGIRTPETVFVTDPSHIENLSGFPVALKVDSPEVVHKSDLGLVFVGLEDKEAVIRRYDAAKKVLDSQGVKDYDFIVQEMVPGTEIILGMKRDPVFGPVIVFGLGGVLVEVMKDISMRVAPLKRKDCIEMIDEIKGKKLLEGYRNYPKVNIQSIISLIMKLSKLSVKEKHIQEIDFNPVMVDSKDAVVVDARFIGEYDA